jgi:F0F1-type ATP synthase assembly protein I
MWLSKFLPTKPIELIVLLGMVAAPLLLIIMSTNSVFVNGNNNYAYAQAG